jgi:hypothetical protein
MRARCAKVTSIPTRASEGTVSDKIRTEFWGHQIDAVMTEIAREAAICQVKLLDPGVIEAVLHNNDSVCGHRNALAFRKLRDLLMMGFVVREKAFDRLGPLEADAVVTAIRDKLKERLGGRLGGPASSA